MADATVSCPSCNATVTAAVGRVERCTTCGGELRVEVQRVEASTGPTPSSSPAGSAQARRKLLTILLWLAIALHPVAFVGGRLTSKTRPYGVDVTYEFLQKDAKGKVRVTSKTEIEGMRAGEDIAAAREGGGGYSVRVESVSPGRAVIKMSFEGGTATLDLVPKVPQERFDAAGSAGMRITVDDIR